MKPSKRSPIKSKPLRYAGKSLDQRIDKLINEDALPYFLASIYCVMIAGYEWWRFYKDTPPTPKTMSFFAILVVMVAGYKIGKIFKEVKALKLGREGERAVGEYLDLLRENGYRVFHDVVGENFNIDHVIVSIKGIFIIETKTYSKPINNDAKVYFYGDSITIDGIHLDRNPLSQVEASARWLSEIIKESTGKEYPIKGVILFPGWYVKPIGNVSKNNTWVLNPKALPTYLENESKKISREEMLLACSHLTRYIRAKESELEKQ